jgi:hypothetical protein
MKIIKINNLLILIFTNLIYNVVQLSSFALKTLAPCFMLSEDSFISRVEDVLFLDIESKITFFITLHVDHELLNNISI